MNEKSLNLSIDLAKEAQELFKNKIKEKYFLDMQNNIWRAAWAYNNILDYFHYIGDPDATVFNQQVIDQAFNPKGGNWWDDFGWAGIASLRALEAQPLPGELQVKFLEMALNCWCFMYGPGWSKKPIHDFNVPFPSDQ